MDDVSDISLDLSTNGDEQEHECSDAGCLGAPPNDTIRSDSDDSDDDDSFGLPDTTADCLLNLEEYRKEQYSKSDPIQENADKFTNSNIKKSIQSLLPSVLMSDGIKLRDGYTPDEIDSALRDLVELTLEAVTALLVGESAKEMVKNTGKTELAHALVAKNWLRFENGKFFPVLEDAQQELAVNIMAGAAAEKKYAESKKVSTFKTCDDELRAMLTFNMIAKLIRNVSAKFQKRGISYQLLLDAYDCMIQQTEYQEIFTKYEKQLQLTKYGNWNTKWFKHFTSRSSLKKFANMPQFSCIHANTRVSPPDFELREDTKFFIKADFDLVRENWRRLNENENNPPQQSSRFGNNRKEKKGVEADPNFVPYNIQNAEEADIDVFNSDQPSSSGPVKNRSPTPERKRQEVPKKPRTDFAGMGFGGAPPAPNSTAEEGQENSPFGGATASQQVANYDDDEETIDGSDDEDSEGEYSDEDVEEVEKRKLAKAKRRKEREERLARKQAQREKEGDKPEPVIPVTNRFAKSVFPETEAPSRPKMSEEPTSKKSGNPFDNASRYSGKSSSEENEPEIIVNSTSSSATSSETSVGPSSVRGRKFAGSSTMPMTIVEGVNKMKFEKRPALPNEPNLDQAMINKTSEEDQQREVYKKKKEKEDRENRLRAETKNKVFEEEERQRRLDQEEEDRRYAKKLQDQEQEQEERQQRARARSTVSGVANEPSRTSEYAIPQVGGINRNRQLFTDEYRQPPVNFDNRCPTEASFRPVPQRAQYDINGHSIHNNHAPVYNNHGFGASQGGYRQDYGAGSYAQPQGTSHYAPSEYQTQLSHTSAFQPPYSSQQRQPNGYAHSAYAVPRTQSEYPSASGRYYPPAPRDFSPGMRQSGMGEILRSPVESQAPLPPHPNPEGPLPYNILRLIDRIYDCMTVYERSKKCKGITEAQFYRNFTFADELPCGFDLRDFVERYCKNLIMVGDADNIVMFLTIPQRIAAERY